MVSKPRNWLENRHRFPASYLIALLCILSRISDLEHFWQRQGKETAGNFVENNDARPRPRWTERSTILGAYRSRWIARIPTSPAPAFHPFATTINNYNYSRENCTRAEHRRKISRLSASRVSSARIVRASRDGCNQFAYFYKCRYQWRYTGALERPVKCS